MWRSNLKANMAGQLFVNDIELAGKTRKLSAGEAPETFLNLPFDDAIAHFLGRRVLTPEEFRALQDAERFRSFTVTRATSQSMIDAAKRQLDTAMQPKGPGLREFVRLFRERVDAADLPGGSRGYVENVYRTTTATSYNAGRYRAQTSPAVREAGLLWRYVTALDTRVRSEHAGLHGKAWPVGDPEAQQVYPPNGYQCRCSMVVVEPSDVSEADMRRTVDTAAALAEGFSGAPTDTIDEEAAA